MDRIDRIDPQNRDVGAILRVDRPTRDGRREDGGGPDRDTFERSGHEETEPEVESGAPPERRSDDEEGGGGLIDVRV